MVDAQNEAIGVLALLFQFDKAGDRYARCGIAQHRMADQRGLDGRDRKARGYRKYDERDDEAWKMAAQHDGEARADACQCGARPPHRLMVGREIEDDAEAVADREPGQKMRDSDLLGHPLAKFCGREKPETRPGQARAVDVPPTGQVVAPAPARALAM